MIHHAPWLESNPMAQASPSTPRDFNSEPAIKWFSRCMDSVTTTPGAWSLQARTTWAEERWRCASEKWGRCSGDVILRVGCNVVLLSTQFIKWWVSEYQYEYLFFVVRRNLGGEICHARKGGSGKAETWFADVSWRGGSQAHGWNEFPSLISRECCWKQWIGLRENLQETIDFPMDYGVFL